MKYIHNRRSNLWRSFWGPIRFLGFLNNILGIPAFSQSDFRRLCKGQFQIVFVPLHPPEQKIVYTNLENTVLEDPFEKIASQVISIPVKKIEEYKSVDYDHFNQLNKELNLLINQRHSSRKLRINGQRKRCHYKIARNYDDIEKIIQLNRDDERQYTIAVVITVEGMHSLGLGHVWHDGKPNPFNINDEVLMDRIDAIKGIESSNAEAWKTSPFLLNVTHAFDIGIFGHAQALSQNFQKIFEYAEPFDGAQDPGFSEGLNKPMSEFGKAIIRRLLNIDEVSNNRVDPGKRILPDIKHMSTKTRRDYYEIIDEHNQANKEDIIPVVISHAAVNGKPDFGENNFYPEDLEDDYKNSKGFNPWSINLYDNEIVKIHETEGLIGIIFDERILAGREKLQKVKKNQKPFKLYGKRMKWLLLIVDQIDHIVKTIMKSNSANKAAIWDRICLGTDFDGQINPINGYKKATDFPGFKSDLERLLAEDKYLEIRMGLRIYEIIEKLCFENAHNFLRRHFK